MHPTYVKVPFVETNKLHNPRPQLIRNNSPMPTTPAAANIGYNIRNTHQSADQYYNNVSMFPRRHVALAPPQPQPGTSRQMNMPSRATPCQDSYAFEPNSTRNTYNSTLDVTVNCMAMGRVLKSEPQEYPKKVKNVQSGHVADKKIQANNTNSDDQTKKDDPKNVRFLTGTIEKVIKWHKLLLEFCHYEVMGPVVSLQEGSVRMQKIMLLRDKQGPVLKVVHYIYDRIDLPNFYIGQVIRCVGRMISPNTLHAINIREASDTEISCLPRLTYICDQEVMRATAMKNSN